MHLSPNRGFHKTQKETAVISLDGNHLSLMGSKLRELPSFKYKKHNDKDVVEFITSIDASVNKLMYDLSSFKISSLVNLLIYGVEIFKT